MGAQTYIEINGKRVDAISGKEMHSTSVSSPRHLHPINNVGVVDGFRRPKPAITRLQATHASKQTQHSQTLMRHSVKKPTVSAPVYKPLQKPSLKPPASRVARAHATPKHPQVSRYDTSTARSSVVKSHAELPIQPYPKRSEAPQDVQQSAIAASRADHKDHELIEKALRNADSHNQVHHAKPRTRTSRLAKRFGIGTKAIAISSAVLAGVLLGGFFAIQNVPNVSMRVAATRAGFDAQMPGYQPAGFGFSGPINYKAGQVTVSFKSTTDQRTYDITQTNSNWNSDALLANFIETEDKQYQTYQDRGRTLYIYDGSNATWIDDGVWFQIEGDSDLTTDQLIRIAASI